VFVLTCEGAVDGKGDADTSLRDEEDEAFDFDFDVSAVCFDVESVL